MTFGQKIKELRTDMGFTQKDLADQLHVSFQTVSKWENDENEPDISTIKRIAKIFSVTTDSLLDIDSEEEVIVDTQTEDTVCHKCGKHLKDDEVYFAGETDSQGKREVHKFCLDCYREVFEKEREKERTEEKPIEQKPVVKKQPSYNYSHYYGTTSAAKSADVFGIIIAVVGAIHIIASIIGILTALSNSNEITVLIFIVIGIIMNVISPFACAVDASLKGRNGIGCFVFGVFFSSIAMIVVGLSPEK